MGKSALKNWKPREIVAFLESKDFEEIKKKRGGDHRCLFNSKTRKYTEVDMGRKSFGAREMLSIVKQSGLPRKIWKK